MLAEHPKGFGLVLLQSTMEWPVESITVGSDAHAPEQVALAWPRARQLLLDTGHRTVQRFTGRRRESAPLD